ncbi:MAG: choline BCCT transporter BetT [Micrococcales bacterium]|nr:choline BCCT transporter BetT [Micrococcales bacterium]
MSATTTTAATRAPEPGPETPVPVRPRVNRVVFTGSIVGVLIIAVWAIVATDQAAQILGVAVGWTAGWFGWFYILLASFVFVFVIGVGVSRFGDVRLGPQDSRPQFTTFSWAAMLFAAGIGTDLMFFSVAEPVTQYLSPPRIEGGTLEAAKEATVWTLFHYGLTGWAMYALMGMALAYFAYRLDRPLAVRSALYPLLGQRLDGWLGHLVDIAAILGTIFGVATSLGIGVVQLNVGLQMLFGIQEGLPAQTGLVLIAVVMAAISATTGVDRGIRVLSQLNVILAIGLAGWLLVTGKTQFLLNAFVMNIGDLVASFPAMTAETFAYDQPTQWMANWTLFFWAWWIAWASFVGMFLARISRGRTIRQFVAGTMIIPFTYIAMWVSIFGNSAIDRIRSGDTAFGEATMAVPEQGFYTLLTHYPAASFLIGLATFVGLLFYVTSADSGALVMANLSSRLSAVDQDGAPWLRIVWAATTGLLTVAMLAVGGIPALQNATVVMGVPFAFVMFFVMFGLYRALRVEGVRVESARHRLPHMFAGRGGGEVERQLATTWRGRLGRALQRVDATEAEAYLDRIVGPALAEVASELQDRGVPATCRRGPDLGIELRTVAAPIEAPFVYRVQPQAVFVSAYGRRSPSAPRETTTRLQIHLDDGGADYDVMGYTSAQLIHDVLDQYERHLTFVRLSDVPG